MPNSALISTKQENIEYDSSLKPVLIKYSFIVKRQITIYNFFMFIVSLFFINFVFFDNYLINFTFKLSQFFF